MPPFTHDRRVVHHGVAVRCDARAMKRRLRQTPLPAMKLAFTRQQSFTEQTFGALQREALHETMAVRYENVFYEIGMIDEERVLRA